MDHQERRDNTRYSLLNSTDWKIETEAGMYNGDSLVNISRSGVCVTIPSNEAIEEGEPFKFTLHHEGKKLLSVNSKVHWMRRSTITNQLYVGLRFDTPLTEFEKRWAEIQLSELQELQAS